MALEDAEALAFVLSPRELAASGGSAAAALARYERIRLRRVRAVVALSRFTGNLHARDADGRMPGVPPHLEWPMPKATAWISTYRGAQAWEEEQDAMDRLKDALVKSPALRPIDYTCDREVILSVDSSIIGVGFILSQTGEDGKRYPSRFGSITWNERERNYS